jgi:hypothetical protein
MDNSENLVQRITEGVQQGRHINNERCRSCANFKVATCMINFMHDEQ